jgi:hypothetical protein
VQGNVFFVILAFVILCFSFFLLFFIFFCYDCILFFFSFFSLILLFKVMDTFFLYIYIYMIKILI